MTFCESETLRSLAASKALRSRRANELFTLLNSASEAHSLATPDALVALARERGAVAARPAATGTSNAVIAFVPVQEADAFAGSMAGAALASHIPRSAFNPIILVVLVAVGAYTLFKPSMGQLENLRHAGSRRHYATAGAVGLGVGLYDGALGPGTGSFFVFALVSPLGYRFLEASAKAKLANFATNLAALVVFIPAGAVAWRVGLVLGVANLAGGYLGARTAVSKGAGFVRAVFVVVVGAFVVKLSYDTAAQFGVL